MKEMTKDFFKIMEVYFDKMIIFPYMFSDEIQRAYRKKYDECNIYMLMLCDKVEMTKVTRMWKSFILQYKNVSKGKIEKLQIYYKELLCMDIPDKFIKISIEKFGEILKVEIEKEKFEETKLLLGLPDNMQNIQFFNIYDIIYKFTRDKETCEDYEVIYIGQSNPKSEYRTVFDRLKKHEKVAEVFRDYNLEYRDKELMVYIMHAKSKLYNMDAFLFLGNTEWNQYDSIGEKIDDTAIIDVTEAMLIYHFKPIYNVKLKDSIPNVNMKTYNQIKKAGINRIEVQLQLYFDDFKDKIRLITKNQKTVSKLRTLKCNIDKLYHKGQSTDILFEDIDDEFYDIL